MLREALEEVICLNGYTDEDDEGVDEDDGDEEYEDDDSE
jgi:hypothetical protein